MIRRILLFIFLLLIQNQASAQDKLLAKIDTPGVSISIDNLDNIYLLSEKNELLKFNAEGHLQSSYSSKNLGPGFTADVSDPLRIVLYSPSFHQVILLNKQLAEISGFRFKDINRNIKLLTSSPDNKGFWIFDESSLQLCKLNRNMQEEYLSGNIFQISGTQVQPELLQASGQYVYLYDMQVGLLQFDRFGTFIKIILVKGLQAVQIKNNQFIYIQNKQLKTMNLINGQTSETKLPMLPFEIKQAVRGNKTMAVLTAKALFIFAQ